MGSWPTRAKRALFWGVIGVAVALPLDALHVVTGVLSYRTPRAWMPFGLQDWWVLPLYFGAGLGLGFGHRYVASRLAGGANPSKALGPAADARAAALGTLALVVAYGSSGFLQAWPYAALALYAALFAVALALVHADARRVLLLHAVGAGIAGPVVEILISSTGAFSYHRPDFMGVALWLPGIYWNAAVASHLLDRFLLGREAASGTSEPAR